MLFNSFQFAVFLPIVFLLYWFVFDRLVGGSKHQLKLQNAFVVVASYVFYGWWDWRFLVLIAFTSFCSWGSGLLISQAKTKPKARAWMWVNIVVNIAILLLFKYYDFFVTEFSRLLHFSNDGLLLKVILPVGISFYTFQALSYSIDIYRGKMAPTKDVIAFFAFISFFPQLVAGPIERATNLLPQFQKKRVFDYETAIDGMRQILWGLFKKMVVADNCAMCVDKVFSDYAVHSGSSLMLGVILFAFQLYCDFSGYSDIAIGTAKLFGIKLMRNFNNPYFATSFADYWKRNHISLTTWFMDYVYYPMIGSSDKLWYWNFCMIVTFLLSGMWHGAGWTFLLWGLYQGVFIVISMNLAKHRKRFEKKHHLKDNRLYETLTILVTFLIVCLGLVMFRAESLGQAWTFYHRIFSRSLFEVPFLYVGAKKSLLFAAVMLTIEWITRKRDHGLQYGKNIPSWLAWVLSMAFLLVVLEFAGHSQSFIYFQF